MLTFLFFAFLIAGIGFLIYRTRQKAAMTATNLANAQADARRVIEMLGGQVLNLVPDNDAARQAMSDASERYNAASSQIAQANTPHRALFAKQSAIEGLYYVRAARTAMGIDPGPPLEALAGQQAAGSVTEDRRIQYDGRQIAASPVPSANTPNYYPGGRVAGRPVPAGWYSEPWWKPALVAGAWGLGSALLFDSMFSGMHGVSYGAQGFESGYGTGFDQGFDQGQNVSWNDNPNWDAGSGDSGSSDSGGSSCGGSSCGGSSCGGGGCGGGCGGS